MWTEDNTLEQLIEGVIRHGPEILSHCQTSADLTSYLTRIDQERLQYPTPVSAADPNKWFMPLEYQDMDITAYLVERCPPQNYERLAQELALFEQNNMMSVLKFMKYLVDTLRENKVVWGVGRGSSVASYVLFLLGVHKIDSVKYDLPIEEFFKGENNG